MPTEDEKSLSQQQLNEVLSELRHAQRLLSRLEEAADASVETSARQRLSSLLRSGLLVLLPVALVFAIVAFWSALPSLVPESVLRADLRTLTTVVQTATQRLIDSSDKIAGAVSNLSDQVDAMKDGDEARAQLTLISDNIKATRDEVSRLQKWVYPESRNIPPSIFSIAAYAQTTQANARMPFSERILATVTLKHLFLGAILVLSIVFAGLMLILIVIFSHNRRVFNTASDFLKGIAGFWFGVGATFTAAI